MDHGDDDDRHHKAVSYLNYFKYGRNALRAHIHLRKVEVSISSEFIHNVSDFCMLHI
jgi:hypothetical protein